MGHTGFVQGAECFWVIRDTGVQGVEQNLEHGVVSQGAGQQDEVQGL